MEVTTIGFLIDEKRAVLEKKLKASSLIDDFDIEDLDKSDVRKDVFVTFKEPINARFLNDTLKKIFGEIKGRAPSDEEE